MLFSAKIIGYLLTPDTRGFLYVAQLYVLGCEERLSLR